MMAVDSKYYTVREVYELLKVPEETILSAINAGELSAVNVAKQGSKGNRPRWRIPEAELGRWMLRRQCRRA